MRVPLARAAVTVGVGRVVVVVEGGVVRGAVVVGIVVVVGATVVVAVEVVVVYGVVGGVVDVSAVVVLVVERGTAWADFRATTPLIFGLRSIWLPEMKSEKPPEVGDSMRRACTCNRKFIRFVMTHLVSQISFDHE